MPRVDAYVQIDDFDVIHAGQLAEWCGMNGYPTATFAGKANSYKLVTGTVPGCGHVLVSRQVSNRLRDDQRHTIVFREGGRGRRPVGINVWIRKRETVTPGADDDPSAAILLYLTDARWIARKAVITARFNIHHPSSPEIDYYSTDPITGQNPWNTRFYQRSRPDKIDPVTGIVGPGDAEWADIIRAIWDTFPTVMGPVPVLPVDLTAEPPQNWQWNCQNSMDALAEVLDHLDLDLVPLVNGEFAFARQGDPITRAAIDQHEINWKLLRTFDREPEIPGWASYPREIVVCFHYREWVPGETPDQQSHQDRQKMAPMFTIRRQTGKGDSFGNTTVRLFDDEPALANEKGEIVNLERLINRADARVRKYLERLDRFADRVHVTYSGTCDGDFQPNGWTKGVAYCAFGREVDDVNDAHGGITTEVIRRPEPIMDTEADWTSVPEYDAWVGPPDIDRRHLAEQRMVQAYITKDAGPYCITTALVMIGCHETRKAKTPPGNDCCGTGGTTGELPPGAIPIEGDRDNSGNAGCAQMLPGVCPSMALGTDPGIAKIREVYDFIGCAPRMGDRVELRFDWQTKVWFIVGIDRPEFFAQLMDRNQHYYSWVEVAFDGDDKPKPLSFPTVNADGSAGPDEFIGRSGRFDAYSWGRQRHNSQGGIHPEVVRMRRATPRHQDWFLDPVTGNRRLVGSDGFRNANGDLVETYNNDQTPSANGEFGKPVAYWVFEYSVGPDEEEVERIILSQGNDWLRNDAPINNRTGCRAKGYIIGLVVAFPPDEPPPTPPGGTPPTIPPPLPPPTTPPGGGPGVPPVTPPGGDPPPGGGGDDDDGIFVPDVPPDLFPS